MGGEEKEEYSLDNDTIRHIINCLRRGTMIWEAKSLCLKRHRKLVHEGEYFKNGMKKKKFFYQCNGCKTWFRDAESLEIDHIDEVGPFKGDWNDYIKRMYCSVDNLQPLCSVCHQKKTASFNAALIHSRSSKREIPESDY